MNGPSAESAMKPPIGNSIRRRRPAPWLPLGPLYASLETLSSLDERIWAELAVADIAVGQGADQIQRLLAGVDEGVRMPGGDAHDVRAAYREPLALLGGRILDEIARGSRQHDVRFLRGVRVQRRSTAGTRLGNDERELLEAVLLADHDVPELAWHVVEARHLVELDEVFRRIRRPLRRFLVALRGRGLRMAMAALRLGAQRDAQSKHAKGCGNCGHGFLLV